VLLDGEYPTNTDDIREILKIADIPFEFSKESETLSYPKDWLIAHGFEIRDNYFTHPKFSKDW
jgi:hypothetical protein